MSLVPGMSSFSHLMSITDTQPRPGPPQVYAGKPTSVQPLPEGTVFPSQKVTDKPLPVVNLTDTDTKQAPQGGSCVTAEPKHHSAPEN